MTHGEVNAPSLRFGIVGLGLAALSTVPAILRHPGARITAVASRNAKELAGFQAEHAVEAYQDIADLCESPNVDAVYIATPTDLHARHVLIAAEHQKHIIVEKPMAITLEDADAMIAAVERNGVQMVVGHSQSFEPPIRKVREIVRSGELGPLGMITSWYFNDWLYRPRVPEELDTGRGGGVVFRQSAHQVDIVRLIGGGLLRSVRASTGVWDQARPTEGSYAAYLEFENGVAATTVYSGYDHFHTTELIGIGESGERVDRPLSGKARQRLRGAGASGADSELALKQARGYGGTRREPSPGDRHQSHFGVTLVSCSRGDMRQSPDGILIYDDQGRREVPLPAGVFGRDLMVQEFSDAVCRGIPPVHSGRWAKATLEVSLALLTSARERREVFLSHQVATAD